MTELLENWILQQLGFVIKLNASSIGKHFQDGILFKKLLQAYGVLSECHTMHLEQSNHFTVCRNNLSHLCPYFRLLNIECDENTINNIATGKGSTIIRILYEMYICFENRKHIYLITSQAKREVLKDSISSKYDVTSIEFSEDVPKHEVITRKLAYPLFQHKHVIDWYNEKYKQIKLRIEEAKQAVKVQSFRSSEFIHPKCTKLERMSECETFSLPEIKSIKDTPISSLHKQDNLISYDEYMRSIKLKKNQTKMYKSLVSKMENMLLEDMWSKILCNQEEEFYKNFTETLLKQSQYEKCIATKLFQIHYNSILQNENRNQVTCLLGKVTEARNEVKADFDKAKIMYNDEKFRILDLHKKLYAEKLKRRYERHYGTCLETMDAIIDMVVVKHKFEEENNCSVPLSLWNDWKQMFFNLQPLHESEVEIPLTADIEQHVDILLNKFDSESVLNDHDIDEYLKFNGEWTTEIVSTVNGETMDKQIILGFIVHRLLENKYPLPASPKPADLPQVTTAAVLLNLHDKDAQDKLSTLLIRPGIYIFDLQTVINHCLETYTREIQGPDVQEEEKAKEKKKLPQKKSGEKKQSIKFKKQAKKKKDNDNINENLNGAETENVNDKETQTTDITEGKEADLITQHTVIGLHGKHLFEILNSGNNIPDSLAVTVIIEYIKSLGNINGWALLDFPITATQASVLELALTGTAFLIGNKELSENIHENTDESDKSQAADNRFSKLVPYPKQMEKTQTYKTYFTTFINLVDTKTTVHKNSIFEQSNIVKNENNINITGRELQNLKSSNEISGDESLISVDSRQRINLKSLQSIYSEQGIYHEFNYSTFDLEMLKSLARLLLGEENKPDRRTSVDLFGQDVLDKLTSPPKGLKKKISLKSKKEKSKVGDVIEKSKIQDIEPSNVTEELPEQKKRSLIDNRDPDKNVANAQESQSMSSKMELKNVSPGDDEWEYSMFIIPDTISISLATVWENIECAYLGNMKNLCFFKRTLNSRLIPYMNFIKQSITESVEKSDNRQDIVSLFQLMFNSVDSELREHTEQKQLLHCKVFEMQQQLWKLCDEKKTDIKQKLTNLIQEHWASNEMCNLTNTYLQMVQTEMDRSTNSLKLLCDYYLAMLEKTTLETNIFPVVISNIDVKSLGDEKVDKKGTFLPLKKSIYNTMFDILTNAENNKSTILSPFHEIIEKSIESTRSKVDTMKKYLKSIIQREENEITPKVKEQSKKSKGKEIGSPKSSQLGSMALKQNLFVEWDAVMNQEIHRVIYRLELIKYRALMDLTLWQKEIQATFNSLFKSILNRYNAEIKSVDNLCEVLQSAIEEETPIQEKLVLIEDKFYVDINNLLFSKPSTHELKHLQEQALDFQFTIEQLGNLLKIMQYVSPEGIIGISPFVYILQDIIHQSTICNKWFLPKIWNNLKLSGIQSIVEKMACTTQHIDWKDFLIFFLDLGFPDLQEILEARQQFTTYDPENTEMISLDKYNDVLLWFEKDLPKNPEAALRIVLVKEFLLKLFQVNKDEINYTVLLLYFCKDNDPRIGFGKALALALGKGIILCEKYLYLEEKDVSVLITQILTEIIENVMQSVAGVVIKDISVHTASNNSTCNIHEQIMSQSRTISSEEEYQSASLKRPNEVKYIDQIGNASDTETSLLYKTSRYSNYSNAQHSSNCDISFKTDLCQDIQWVSRIPIETVLTVLTCTVFKTKLNTPSLDLQEILLSIKMNEAYDSQDGCIPAHILINLDSIKQLFSEVHSFQAFSMNEEISKVIIKNDEN